MNIARDSFALKLLAAFAGLSLLSVAYTYSRPASLYLTLEMASSRPSLAQLFYDTGAGFNEAESSTIKVNSSSLTSFQQLSFVLPRTTILHLRFDPLTTEGHVVIRHIAVTNNRAVLRAIAISDITPFQQIAACTQHQDQVDVTTTPGANDPGVNIELEEPLRLHWIFAGQNNRRLGIINLCLIALYFPALALRRQITSGWRSFAAFVGKVNTRFSEIAATFQPASFIRVDAFAVWVYAGMLFCFCLACLLDLNGSSASLYSAQYGNGPIAKPWIGSPKDTRSDEWSYVTPNILNQYYRADRFAMDDTDLGNHDIALTANVPVKSLSTVFRPEFWAFFVLPLSYAFSVYWQAKALMLAAGIFTFLLWVTGSSCWSLIGALWYFFSPFTQWSFSWPSALPEMIGSLCLATVCFCYLTVSRDRRWLAVSFCGTIFAAVDFAMCAYLPHMIPLVWVAATVAIAWCVAKRAEISTGENRMARLAAIALVLAILIGVGWTVFGELKTAISAVADTLYPGRRVVPGGTLRVWQFASHFLQWMETEKQFPAAIGNMSEGSGFLWLAPLTLFCLPKLRLEPFQKLALIALWFSFGLLFCWAAFPMSAAFGKITQLEKSTGARCLPALGLANIGIVVLTASRFKPQLRDAGTRKRQGLYFVFCTAVFLVVLRFANQHLNHYFPWIEVLLPAVFLGFVGMLLLTGNKRALAASLVIPQALMFGAVNPIERGLPMFTDSPLHEFVQRHRELLNGKWLVYSATPVRSGFVAAAGCVVYTGTRYLPDIDHFALLAARGLDLNVFNRLGYLDAHAIPAGAPTRFDLTSPVVVDWGVAPNDPLLPQLGIRYLAFDYNPPPEQTKGLVALSDGPVDGLWLYRI